MRKKPLGYQRLLDECKFEFKLIDGVWFRRKITKDKRNVWREVVYSNNRGANNTGSIY